MSELWFGMTSPYGSCRTIFRTMFSHTTDFACMHVSSSSMTHTAQSYLNRHAVMQWHWCELQFILQRNFGCKCKPWLHSSRHNESTWTCTNDASAASLHCFMQENQAWRVGFATLCPSIANLQLWLLPILTAPPSPVTLPP